MTDVVTVAITLPINGTPLERAQALVAAMQNPNTLMQGRYAIGQLLGDIRLEIPGLPIHQPYTLRFFGDQQLGEKT